MPKACLAWRRQPAWLSCQGEEAVLNKVVSDQADGLRCLMAQHAGQQAARVVALVGSGRQVGVTSVIMNLAAALVQQGQEVLLLDEHDGEDSATARCTADPKATPPAGSWHQVAAGALSVIAAAGRMGCGALLLPASQGCSIQAEIRDWFQGQVVLIDARLDEHGALSALAAQADDVLVVLRPQAASITAAYACIKQLHYAHALQQLRIMINLAMGGVAAPEPRRVLANLSAAGSRYLGLALEPAGCVAADPQLAHAQRLKLNVVEAFQTSAAAVDLRRIAAQLLQWPRKPLHAA
jgi:flagellar biosynthesis protein FlhG